MITMQNRNNGGQRAAHYGSGIISPKLRCHNIFETDKDQLKGKWDKETWGGLREGERERKKRELRESEKEKEWEREQAVLAGPWLRARPQLFMRQCTCQELADKHNSKAERKSNSASVGNAHNAPGGTHLGPFLCCSRINREQAYLSTAWFSSRAKRCWNSLCLFVFFPPYFIYLPLFLAEMLVPVGSIFSWLISPLFRSLYFSETAIMPLVLFKSTASLCWSPTCLH